MDPSSPCDESHSASDEREKSMILEFPDKLRLASSDPAHQQSGDGDDALSGQGHGGADQKGVISVNSYHPPAAASQRDDAQLWPSIAELGDGPPSPTAPQDVAIKQVISESSYQPSEQAKNADEPPRAEPAEADGAAKQERSESDGGSAEQADAKKEAMPMSIDLPAHPRAAGNQSKKARPPLPGMRDPAPELRSAAMESFKGPAAMESYKGSARAARLSSVVEESESFARREFGDNELNYMSTHSSANHAANQAADLSALQPPKGKHVSYKHNNYHQFNYNLRISQEPRGGDMLMTSKSAPAGTATRTGSAFGLFRRGASEHSGLRLHKRTPYRPRKPKTIASTLLWPLVKLKDGYVGCMMGLEGTGDLRGMAQGGTYGDSAWYFADLPLSKSDSRNYG